MTYRILILVGVAAALVGFFFMYSNYILPDDQAWIVRAEAPKVIGGYGDNFCYDGEGVRALSGALLLSVSSGGNGSIDLSISSTDGSGPLHIGSTDELAGTIRIISQTADFAHVSEQVEINGDIEGGDPDMPQTYAALGGEAAFDVYVNGKLRYKALLGDWSLADAVRQSDGSIRQSGLVYSPLLRDKSGFSDPKRKEFTLLLHSDAPDENSKPPYSLVLHLVFSNVTIEKQPSVAGQ